MCKGLWRRKFESEWGEAGSFCGSALPLTPPPLFLVLSVLPVIGADGFIEIFTLLEVGLAFVNLFLARSPVSHPFCPSWPATHKHAYLPLHLSSHFTHSLTPSNPVFCVLRYNILVGSRWNSHCRKYGKMINSFFQC